MNLTFFVLLFYFVFGGIMGFIVFCVLWLFLTWGVMRLVRKYVLKVDEKEFNGIPLPLWMYAIMAVILFFPTLYVTSLLPDLETLPVAQVLDN